MRRFRVLLIAFCLIPCTAVLSEQPPGFQSLRPGVTMTLIAEHPDLVTPTGVDVDQEGRIWVVATHTHFRPEDYVGPKHDEILVFDPSGDQEKPRRTVFYNQTVATMDLELGTDGWVYLAERDRILRVRDTDGDDVADESEDIAVLDTEADYPHNGLSGLSWHPSGDLVFGLGENYAKSWTITGTDGSSATGTGEGGIFRCSADGKGLRRIAKGFWNPFGICVRQDGEVFAAENDPGARPPCRLLHVIEGGDYGYQRNYGNESDHPFVCWNGQLRGTLPMIHPTGEAPCGVQPLGNGLIVPTWSDHRIDFYPLQPRGASFSAERLVLADGPDDFRPVCITRQRGVDGNTATFFLTDWVFVSYQSHHQGRLWRLDIDLNKADWIDNVDATPNEARALATALRSNKREFPLARLLQMAGDEDPFLARSALIALSRRAVDWRFDEVTQWNDVDRCHAVLAIKIASSGNPKLPAADWINRFLQDESDEVVFETLRWICDTGRAEHLDEVDQLLKSDRLDYRLFDAIMATKNTLQGDASDGVRHAESLMALLEDDAADPALRAHALRLLPIKAKNKRQKLTFAQIEPLITGQDDRVAVEAVRKLIALGTPNAKKRLAKVAGDPRYPAQVRVESIAGLSPADAAGKTLLLNLGASDDREIREEAIRSLRGGEFTAVQKARLRDIEDQFPESSDLIGTLLGRSAAERPPTDDIDAWLRHLDGLKSRPDSHAGGRLFHHTRVALCTQCHRHSGRGNAVGPDLTEVGKGQDRRALLESLLQPGARVAPEYRTRVLLLDDGSIFTGIHLRTGGSSGFETLRDNQGKERRIRRSEIESSRESNVSLMPSGLADTLTDRELRDLLEFLASKGDD